jgi:hypothetical protein
MKSGAIETLPTFTEKDITAIKNGDWLQLDYHHPAFSRRVAIAYRHGLIANNEMVTAYLFYHCISALGDDGHIEQHLLDAKIQRVHVERYNYTENVDKDKLTKRFANIPNNERHYLSINLPRSIEANLLYTLVFSLQDNVSNRMQSLLRIVIKRSEFSKPEKRQMLERLSQYYKNQNIDALKTEWLVFITNRYPDIKIRANDTDYVNKTIRMLFILFHLNIPFLSIKMPSTSSLFCLTVPSISILHELQGLLKGEEKKSSFYASAHQCRYHEFSSFLNNLLQTWRTIEDVSSPFLYDLGCLLASKQDDIAIYSLDINMLAKHYPSYEALPAREKIDLLANHIDSMCRGLSKDRPHAMWIICWREYGINNGENARAISDEDKNYLKEKMSALAQKYSHLVIIAGPTEISKTISQVRADSIKHIYKSKGIINIIEKQNSKYRPTRFMRFEKENKKYIKRYSHDGVKHVLQTICFGFQGKAIKRHAKLVPYKETMKNDHLPNAIYKPPKGRKVSPFFLFHHPQSGQEILVGVEICAEHDVGIIKKIIKTSNMTKHPYLHFILSDRVQIDLNNIQGEYAIHVDSLVSPKLIVKEDLVPQHITFYNATLFNKHKMVVNQVAPLFPFETRVMNIMDEVIAHYPSESNQRKILLSMKRDALKIIRRNQEVDNIKLSLRERISHYSKILTINDPDILDMFAALITIIKKELHSHHGYKDIDAIDKSVIRAAHRRDAHK